MGSPALLYWASALAEQEAARIRAECSNVTDGPGGVQSLTLFSPHFSSCSPLMCAFKPSCLLQLNVHFIFWPPPSLHTMWFPLWSVIFSLSIISVCVRCVGTCASTHISAETQSVRRPECPSWLCALDRRGLKCVFSFFFSSVFQTHIVSSNSSVTNTLHNTFLGYFWRTLLASLGQKHCTACTERPCVMWKDKRTLTVLWNC